MAATELTAQQCTPLGLEVTFTAANADGNYFINNGRMVLRIKNGDTASINVIIQSPVPCDQGYTHNVIVTIDAGKEKDIGPFRTTRFNDENGKVNITYSGVTNVMVALIEYIP